MFINDLGLCLGNHSWGDEGAEVDVPTYLSDHDALDSWVDDESEDEHGGTRDNSLKVKKIITLCWL